MPRAVALAARSPQLPRFALVLDGRLAQAQHNIAIRARIGHSPCDLCELLIVNCVANLFHGLRHILGADPCPLSRWARLPRLSQYGAAAARPR